MLGLLLLSVLVTNVCAFYMGYEHFGKPAGVKAGHQIGLWAGVTTYGAALNKVLDSCPDDVRKVVEEKMDSYCDAKDRENK